MKHTMKIIATLLLAVVATACDPGYTEDVIIRNESSHYVHIALYGMGYYDSETATFVCDSFYLAPNEGVMVEQLGGIGSASFEEGENCLKAHYGDSVKFGFGGIAEEILVREKTYYAWETTGISPYNFHSLNYIYEEKRNKGRVFHDLPYYGKLTFTITDEHYEEAER